MMRFMAALGLLLTLCSFAHAAAHVDLSHARCEDPRVIKLIKDSLQTMTFGNGRPLSPYLGNNSQLSATTIEAAAQKLICRVSVNFDLHGQQAVRGRFIVRAFPGGKMTAEFEGGY